MGVYVEKCSRTPRHASLFCATEETIRNLSGEASLPFLPGSGLRLALSLYANRCFYFIEACFHQGEELKCCRTNLNRN